tara:strand:+ start:28739 stop:29149 length:411 start_codon:yes stop_codon:yes gene_type:complete
MLSIEKKYHIYSAHRNLKAGEKCGRIHGHTYDLKIKLDFTILDNSGITVLFSDIDAQIEPILKDYDHYFIVYELDPLCDYLKSVGEKIRVVPFETSAENFSIWLYNRIKRETDLPIAEIQLAETKSSNIIYNENGK